MTEMRIISSQPKRLRTDEQKRRDKAVELFTKGHVVILDRKGTMFKVWSMSEPAKNGNGKHLAYSVLLDEAGNSCSCPDNAFRGSECKHILAAKMERHELGYAIQ